MSWRKEDTAQVCAEAPTRHNKKSSSSITGRKCVLKERADGLLSLLLLLLLLLLGAVMANAMWAAYRRALELGGENSNVGPGRSR
jgi:hypothetical protein